MKHVVFIIVVLSIVLCPQKSIAWGFWAHKQINRYAIYTLPEELLLFYKANKDYIEKHAVDPDQRRYINPDEAAHHYIDLDHYDKIPLDSFPKNYLEAKRILSIDTMNTYGNILWHIPWVMKKLEDAFYIKDIAKILKYSAELGHYIGDAHVPLHTTENYDGQLTGQNGIHSLWESKIPENSGAKYQTITGQAQFIENPSTWIFEIILQSHYALDTVFPCEKAVKRRFEGIDYTVMSIRNNQKVKTYTPTFLMSYSQCMGDMVERRYTSAINAIGSAWFTCWKNAGSPTLSNSFSKNDVVEVEPEISINANATSPTKGHNED